MIRYTLRCDKEHEFEAWFRSSADYDLCVAAGEAICPLCNSTAVERAIMSPAIARAGKPSEKASEKSEKVSLVAPDPRQQGLRDAIKELRRQVTENADYVGDRFAEEARKIHYSEIEPRGIYGEASGEEAKALAEEGIEFSPLPSLPDERN
jgi:hypothetical protein